MKYITLFTLFFMIAMSQFTLAQIPRTISYQGVLTDNTGNPKPDGDYSITFSFYEIEAGGNNIWSEVKTLTAIKGLFSTSLGDLTAFGVEVKFDKPYWLGIKVGEEAELAPRIALTSAGYSFTSDVAQNIIDGKVVKSLNTLKDDVILEGAGGTTINTNGGTITISSSGTGGTGIQGVQNTNNTIDISNPNGPTATLNVKIPLTLNGVANGSDYLFTANNTGSGHGILGVSALGYGSVGVATGTTGQTIGVAGNSLSPDGYAISGWNLATTGPSIGIIGKTNSPTGVGVQGTGGANGWGVFGQSSGGYGVYGNSPNGAGVVGTSNVWAGVYGETSTWFGVWGKATGDNGKGVYGESFNSYGVWGKSPNGAGVVGESENWVGVYGQSNDYLGVYGKSINNTGVYGESVNGFAGFFAGKVGVSVLQINGGSDLAEPFEINEKIEIEPGSVMIIDSENPGKLKLSNEAYDKKVAGIVSGAGGVNPGITLHQDGVLEGNILVAMVGKVYCKVEAFSGPIKAGDLLTTSNISGYAMKVTDNQLSQGSIIGKAMTELKSGKGLVLVLVNLQ